MPFEFNGKPPALGAQYSASPFSSFLSTTSFATDPNPRRSFGSPVGGPAGIRPSSFGTTSLAQKATPLASLTPSPTDKALAKSAAFEIHDTTLADYKGNEDQLAQALQRAKLKRPAIFGDVARAADDLVLEHLDSLCENGEGCHDDHRDEADALIHSLQTVAKDNPAAMRFVRFVFDRLTKPEEQRADYDEGDRAPYGDYVEVFRDHEGLPIAFEGLWEFEIVRNACATEIRYLLQREEILDAHAHGPYNNQLPERIMTEIANGHEPLCVVDMLTNLHAFDQKLIDIADDIFELVVRVLDDWSHGWDGRGQYGSLTFSVKRFEQTGKLLAIKTAKSETQDKACCYEGRSRDDATEYRAEFLDQPFRFLNLAAELRNRVYQYAMVPGTIGLVSCAHHLPAGLLERLGSGLLVTCRQINEEAKGMLLQNRIIANVLVRDGVRSIFHQKQVPAHILPKITSLSVVLDFTDLSVSRAGMRRDWRPLQALTSLKHLRVMAIEGDARYRDEWPKNLKEIITRVPASCAIEYGYKTEEEKRFCIIMRKKLRRTDDRRRGVEEKIEYVQGEELKKAAEKIPKDVVAGIKSGVVSAMLPWLEEIVLLDSQ